MAVTFLALFATSLRSAVVAPAVMTLLGLGWVRAARRWLLVGLLAAVAAAAVFFAVFPGKRAELTPPVRRSTTAWRAMPLPGTSP